MATRCIFSLIATEPVFDAGGAPLNKVRLDVNGTYIREAADVNEGHVLIPLVIGYDATLAEVAVTAQWRAAVVSKANEILAAIGQGNETVGGPDVVWMD